MSSKTILVVAGEASGDLHGAHLIEALYGIDPALRFLGMAGEASKKAGMELLYHHASLSVVGITEVLLKLRSLLRALTGLKQAIEREKPNLVLLIDFPDFNLRLAKFAHRRGVPVVYYISPQVWAWRSGRVKSIAQWVKKIIVFFAFEVPLYEAAGADVVWVGHPLLDTVKPSMAREEALRRFGLDPRKRTIGLLPGSREHEVERLLPALLCAAEILWEKIPNIQLILSLAPGLPLTAFSSHLAETSTPIKVVEGRIYDVMNVCDLLVTASGTATLEAALLEKPMVIVYKVSSFSYWIGRMLVHVKHIGLVNLVAGRRIVPELLQKEARPERIAEEALSIVNDPARYREMVEGLRDVRRRLGEPGATQRAAHIVYGLLQQ